MSLRTSVKNEAYFLCPVSEAIAPPPAGPLCLGSIIRSTSTPTLPLNKSNLVPVENLNSPVVETNWMKTITNDRKPRSRGHEEFLQFVKRGSGVYFKHSSRERIIFEFGTVTTASFEPTSQYVAEAVKTPAVKAWLREPKQRLSPIVSLYLVTGIKLAKGAKVNYSTSVTTTIRKRTDTSALTPIYGLSFGPWGHFFKKTEDETKFKRESEFVFAFRVKRLRFRYGRYVKIEEFTKGALLESAEDENGGEVESVSIDDADDSNTGSDSDVDDIGNDSDGSDAEHDADDSSVRSARFVPNVIIENSNV